MKENILFKRFSILFVALFMFMMALPMLLSFCTLARAQQPQCTPTGEADAYLLKKYNEAISGAGMGDDSSNVWEVLVSPDGATFTILVDNLLTKQTCIVGSGHNWAQIPVPHFQEPKQKL